MKTLDQFASVISPLVAGFVLVQAKERAACFMFVIYNLVSWIGEAYLLVRVYNAASELSERKADIVDLKGPSFLFSFICHGVKLSVAEVF